MRTLSTPQSKLLAKPKYQVYSRVRIDDGTGTFWDLSTVAGHDWIQEIDITEDMNNPCATAKIELSREWYFLSLSSMVTASKLNNLGGSLHPLITVGREIKIEVATIPLGSVPQSSDWQLIFDGFTDQVETGPDWNITVQCRDLGEACQDTYSKMTRGYCGVGLNYDGSSWTPNAPSAAETVIQQIINDSSPWTSPTLFTPTSPGWTIFGGYNSAGVPAGIKVEMGTAVLDAITNLATQIGWDIRYLWDNGTSQYRLTFWSPTRTSPSVLYTFTKDMIFDWQRCQQDVTQVRNVIQVNYQDPTGVSPDGVNEAIVPVIVTDPTSISKYHSRFMSIQVAACDAIDTSTLATQLANAILSDLKEPQLDSLVETPLFWPIMLGDFYKFSADFIHFDSDQSLAVINFKHTITKDKCRTLMGVRGVPSGSANAWWERMATWGYGIKTNNLPGQTPTPNGSNAVIGGVHIGGAANTPTAVGQIPNPKVSTWVETELHISTSSGFTPSQSTFVAKGRQTDFYVHGLTVGTTYYARLINIDRNGNRTAPSAQIAIVPRTATFTELPTYLQCDFNAYLNTGATVPGATGAIVPYDTINWDNTSNFNPGTHKFTAPAAGKYTFHAYAKINGSASTFGTVAASLSLHVNASATASANGSPVEATSQIPASAGNATFMPNVSASLSLAQGDTVEVHLNYGTPGIFAGTTYTTGKADTKFIGAKESTN